MDDPFLLLFNAHNESLAWTLPIEMRGRWQVAADSTVPRVAWGESIERTTTIPARSLRVLLFRPRSQAAGAVIDLTAREARYKENMAPTTRGACAPIARHGALVVRVPQGDNAGSGH